MRGLDQPAGRTSVQRVLPVAPGAKPLTIGEDPWFYHFEFEEGLVTPCPHELAAMQQTRAELVLHPLDEEFGCRWGEVRVLDIGCHEGWFATQLAARGAGEVVAIEPALDRLSRARGIVEASGLNVQLSDRSLFDLERDKEGPFDIVLFLGLLYHLDNPVQALARVFELTRDLCVIETQVARAAPSLHCEWGTGGPRVGPAIAVVPADEAHAQKRALALVPTYDALIALLRGAGFDHVEQVPPGPHMHPQFVAQDRVVAIARKQS